MVVILGNVDLRVCRNNCAPHTCSDKRRNGKCRFQRSILDITALRSTTMPCLLVKYSENRFCNNQLSFAANSLLGQSSCKGWSAASTEVRTLNYRSKVVSRQPAHSRQVVAIVWRRSWGPRNGSNGPITRDVTVHAKVRIQHSVVIRASISSLIYRTAGKATDRRASSSSASADRHSSRRTGGRSAASVLGIPIV
jgi:hypothetical protein